MKNEELFLEDSLREDWSSELDTIEVPLEARPIRILGLCALLVGTIVAWRIISLNTEGSGKYTKRAFANLNAIERTIAPRGLILDREGKIIADNKVVFSISLNTKEFLKNIATQEETLSVIHDILGIVPEEIRTRISEETSAREDFAEPLVLREDASQSELVKLRSKNLPNSIIKNSFARVYPDGDVFSSVVGYTGLLNASDLLKNPDLTGEDRLGKAGLERMYDETLRGQPGFTVQLHNARGKILGNGEQTEPHIGQPLHTTLDGDLERYIFKRFKEGLASLGRTSGVAIAMNPQNGEILSLLSFPTFDNNAFVESGRSGERAVLIQSPLHPLFNRAVSGVYNPGSTIKPLVGLAALTEGVVTPEKTVFSPGYLDVPNPYHPDKPTRYLDWRFQGTVNLYSAIAQSSNVYFYYVGGGAGDVRGLGINRLIRWWKKFRFDVPTGIDLPNEESGFLPTPEWKESHNRGPWLLGDTYNVAIGQGDFAVTPLELLNYIDAFANGGKLYVPHVNQEMSPRVVADFSSLSGNIKEIQEGMKQTVQAKMGTAHLLADLPFDVAAKTGSAQIENNQKENAFFVGYAPANPPAGGPQIALLILIEQSKEGSLNAVPIAKDILNWYYENRLKTR